MALTGALFSGVSGVNSNGNALNVIGDNIANVNTAGFKSTRSVFFDLLSADVGGSKVGRGSRFAAAQRLFAQGGVETTNSATDLAIQGHGFFVLSPREAANGQKFYTRAGQFNIDKDGLLVDPQGLRVQGVRLSSSGEKMTGLVDINVNTRRLVEPTATTKIDLSVQLNSIDPIPSAATLPADNLLENDRPDDWFAASNFSTVVTIYDSLGAPHDINFVFRKTTGVREWEYRILANGGEIESGFPDEFQQISQPGGLLKFNDDGTLDEAGSTFVDIGPIDWDNDSVPLDIRASEISFFGSTQFSLPSAIVTLNQDGIQSGTVTGISIDADGVITGLFSSGRAVPLYRLAMADFASPEGLTHVGNTLFTESTNSGQVLFGDPGTGSFGTVLSGSLELSTVDLATEFVKMVTTQRGFQASSRTITVTDTLLEEVANLKR